MKLAEVCSATRWELRTWATSKLSREVGNKAELPSITN